MTRKIAKSADQTSLRTPGTTETPGVLRSPPVAYREPRRLLSSTPFQSSSGECRITLRRKVNSGRIVICAVQCCIKTLALERLSPHPPRRPEN